MRRHRFATFAAVGALVLAGCGDEAADTADRAGTQAEEAAERATDEAQEAAGDLGAADAVGRTRELVDDVGGLAERLAQDADVDVDEQLQDAEQRARELAERARDELQGSDQELGQALGTANERLAETASRLPEITDPDQARQVVEEDLGQVADELRAATDQQVPDDVRRRLEQARDRVDELRRELPSPGG